MSFDINDCDVDDVIHNAITAYHHVEHKHSPTPHTNTPAYEEPNSDEEALAAEFIDGW